MPIDINSDTTTVYQYLFDPSTRIFKGRMKVGRSPSGEAILWANATKTPPPPMEAGKVAVFNDGWDMVEDYRGKLAYHTTTRRSVAIVELGPLPEGHTLLVPPADGVWTGSEWVTDSDVALAARKQELKRQLNLDTDKALSSIVKQYPDTEILSWAKQEQQAAEYLAWVEAGSVSPEPTLPTVTAIADQRGVTKLDLCQRIVTKAQAFEAASAALFGLRQRIEDQIDACDAETITTFTYSLGA